MTNQQFIAKAYEILDSGRIEINGKLFYSEESVMDALEWMNANLHLLLEDTNKKVMEAFMKGFEKLQNPS